MGEVYDTNKHELKNKNISVFAIFRSRPELETALEDLKAEGFRNADISALLANPDTTKEFAHTKGTKAPEAATTGAATGAVVGGALGWLIGVGTIAVPPLGALVAAGPIVALIAGVGAGGAFGGLAGALIGLGMPEYEATRYEGRVKAGGILVSVHCDTSDWEKKAKEVLKRNGATDISSTTEADSDSSSTVERQKPYPMSGNY